MASCLSVSGLRLRSLQSAGRRTASYPLTPCRPVLRSFSLLRPNAWQRPQAINVSSSLFLGTRNFSLGKPTAPPNSTPPTELDQLEAAAPTPPVTPLEPAASSLPHDAVDTLSAPVDTSALSTITDAASLIPPPMHYGDLSALGLGGYTPWGIVEWSLEYLHVWSQLPWFWTIVVGSALWRTLTMPIMIMSARNGERMQRVQPENGIQPVWNLGVLGIHFPVMIGCFLGIRDLCQLPVEQLQFSGMAWLPDLTVADTTFILPAVAFIVTNLNVLASKSNTNVNATPLMGHMANLGHALSLVTAGFAMYWPSGLALYIISVSVVNLLQTLLIPPRLTLEERGRHPTFKESFQSASTTFKESVQSAKSQK
ncbi:60Kd inner membrane protein-domain-containing protein [Cyathus striatus]|nr:60Kd inner membrane protein-domain-containing protein [Cyathus striatus]